MKTQEGRTSVSHEHFSWAFGSTRTKGQIRLTYTSHLGGSVQGADQANGHQAAESGHDELVTTLAEVDGGMVGSLCYSKMKE
jgi:hypothetical protein